MNIRSVLTGATESLRSYWQGPFLSSDPNAASLLGTGGRTLAGVSVNEETALRYSAVWSAVTQISQTIGSLPIGLYRKLKPRGRDEMSDHPIHRVLQRPNPETSSMVFRETLQAHLLLWGNAYAEIQWNGRGNPEALWQIHPGRVQPFREDFGKRAIKYRVDGERIVSAENMLHIPGFSGDGIVGYSVIGQGAQNLGLGLAAEQFGAAFFGNGSSFGGILTHPGKLGKDAKQGIREAIETSHQGSAKAHRFIVLGEGMTYTPIGIPPNAAQFIETRKFGTEDVARWFNMPPHMLKDLDRSTNNNIEHQSMEFVMHTIRPWCVRWEDELERKLIAPSEFNIQYVHLTMDALLRGDTKTRYDAYGVGRTHGWLSANDIRQFEDMDPLPGEQGDLYLVQQAQAPINLLSDLIQSEIDKNNTPAPAPVSPNAARSEEIAELREEIATLRQSAAEHRSAVDALMANIRELHTVPNELRQQVMEHLSTIKTQEQEIATKQALILLLTERADTAERDRDVQSEQKVAAVTRAESAESQVVEADARAQKAEAIATDLQATLVLAGSRHEATVNELVCARSDAEAAATIHRETDRKLAEALTELADRERALADAIAAEAVISVRAGQLGETAEERAMALEIAHAALIQAQTDAETARTATETARQDAELAQNEATSASEKLTQAEQAVLDAQAARNAAETAATEAREATKAAEAIAAQARQDALEAQQAKESFRDEAETAKVATADAAARRIAAESERQAALEALAAQKETSADRDARVIGAFRDIFEDIMGRMVRRETEKARRNQGTPVKLRAWAESFYLLHEDTCVDALRAAVTAHLAWIGSDADADTVARAWLAPNLTAAVQQIRTIADGDPDEYAQTLERVLTKWEQERPKALADVVLREGIAYVRR